MTSIITIIAAYFGALVILALVARPYRRRMADLAREIARDVPEEREFLQRVITSSVRWRSAVSTFLVFLLGIVRTGRSLDEEACEAVHDRPAIFTDPRMHQILDCQMVSAFAVNPIFGTLAYAAQFVFKMKARAYLRRKYDSTSVDSLRLKAV